jgi:hypothetical protein
MTTPDEPTALYFAYTPTAPDLDHFDVKRVVPAEIFGQPTALTVIGESHYVGIPQLGFHEICSCNPLPAETMHYTPLEQDLERAFSFENERLSATTIVETRPIDSLPDEERVDVAYRFGPDAWTTITVDQDTYETYHTYPEHEIALYTRTRLSIELKSTDTFESKYVNTPESKDVGTTSVPTEVKYKTDQ